jgi:hypothetical protein
LIAESYHHKRTYITMTVRVIRITSHRGPFSECRAVREIGNGRQDGAANISRMSTMATTQSKRVFVETAPLLSDVP